MKLILDSNVIVSAFATRGICASLFEAILVADVIVTSEDILDEVSRILKRKIKLPQVDVEEIILFLRENTEVMNYDKLEKQVCRDKDDDNVLALALSNGIHIIVTGDKDLLILKKYKTISIISPKEFWKTHIS